jgi:hypothetical protein
MERTTTVSKTNKKQGELVIRIKDARLRQHIEDKARQTGSTPEALVNAMFDGLKESKRAIEFYQERIFELFCKEAEQRREHEESLREFGKQLQERMQKELEAQLHDNAQFRKMIQTLEALVNTAHTWRECAEKAIALCEKYAVKVGYFNTVRRQRDELLGLVERFLGGKTVHPDEVGEIYAIAHSGLIDRMIDRIEITAPPEVAPFHLDPSLFPGGGNGGQ